jgi:nitrite reductase/ring-hydroxylating ferredoxin subunit
MTTTHTAERYVYATSLDELAQTNCLTVHIEEHNIVLFKYGEQVYAVDNRCPHMGFPLNKGTVRDGILTCHWHHARFDLASGGTFDQWADDVRSFPVALRDGEIWIDTAQRQDPLQYQRERLQIGLERDISLVLAKSAINLLNNGVAPDDPYRLGVDFGVSYRRAGWGQGLTIHTCMMKLIPHLDAEDRPRALYHGLSAVAGDTDGHPPRFMVQPLPILDADTATLRRWFRQFIEVRDNEGAERCLISAVRAGASREELADMLFAAATDHRYITVGHPLDFTNKALEALDFTGWEQTEDVLTSLVMQYADASRMEEANAWRYPVDLIIILDKVFAALPEALAAGQQLRGSWDGRAELIPVLLGDDAQASADALLDALRAGCTEVELASAVSYAAALRIARFHTSNEFPDWDTALHTFTFANAVEEGLRRIGRPQHDDEVIPLLRGVFDAAMSVYLDRFLNIPPARLPQPNGDQPAADDLLADFSALLNRQQQVNEAGELVARYLAGGGNPDALVARLGQLLLREDRDFHTIQMIQAAVEQYYLLRRQPQTLQQATYVLVAAARYLAAHSPTVRRQGQTYTIAQRLARGEMLFEGE